MEARACRVTRFIANWREHNGLDGDESGQDPTDGLLERALQTPLLARTTDPLADQLGQREPYRCAFFEGFSLHANVAVQAHDREGLLRLCRYGARQAFSQKQLSESYLTAGYATPSSGRGGHRGPASLSLTPPSCSIGWRCSCPSPTST